MDIALWMLIGAAAGWASFTYLGINADRGAAIAMAIGAVGGLIGGKMVAPMFASPPPAELGMAPLFYAAAVAVALLLVGNLVHKRWGV